MDFACGILNLEFITLVGSVPSILRWILCSIHVLRVFFLWPVRVEFEVDVTEVASKH